MKTKSSHFRPSTLPSKRGQIALLAVVASLFSATGCAHKSRGTVLFDEGHGQMFLVEKQGPLDLSGLSNLIRDQGLEVKTNTAVITEKTLAGVDALVVSGPFVPFTRDENDAAARFVHNGGQLCIMLHIAGPLGPLLYRLNVETSNGVIREREHVIGDDPLTFHVATSAAHQLTADVPEFDVFGAWALHNTTEGSAVVAQTSASSWVDLNGNQALDAGDAVQPFAVVMAGELGRGRFVVFGDDAMFQNQFLKGGNATLGRNLAKWLGEKR